MEAKFHIEKPAHQPSTTSRKKRAKFSFPFFKNKEVFTWKNIFVWGSVGVLTSILIVVGMVAWFSRELPEPNKLLDRSLALSTKIYDRTGTHVLYEIHGDQQRTLVTLEEIPRHVKDATVAVEDKNFYQHQGFDIRGIARAIVTDILAGGKAQGGSTITQQFVKNALLTRQKTFTRKLKELVLSYQLEKNFSKDEILQFYLNEIPYGGTAYGVQSASRVYFDKDVKDVTLAEAAILASLPQAPSFYSPWGNNRDKLIGRSHVVLDLMVDQKYISREDADKAKKEEVVFKEPGRAITAPHFVMYVRQLLSEKYDEATIEQGGLKVITTLDYDKQLIAEEEVDKGTPAIEKSGASNAALVALDAKTGEILAMVGSRDYFNDDIDGKVNVVLRERQPGSSFKPIVYATAFQKGFTQRTTLYDVLTNFAASGNEYIPKNYTGKEYGPVSMKQALAGSLNISAVKTLYLAGLKDVIKNAQELGYTSLTDPDRYGLTLVLGGGEVTLLEHAAAYTAFAQDGKVATPMAIIKIEDKNGRVLEEFKPADQKKVFDEETARQINDILSDNSARTYIFGSRNNLTTGSLVTAAKTGTTNDYHDAWTIGYTPTLVAGVWVGNNDNTAMHKGADGSVLAAPIWNKFMQRAFAKGPKDSFTKPALKETGKAMLDGKLGGEQMIKIDKTTGLRATDSTPPENIEEKKFYDLHDILYYIDKNNPRGDAPAHPENDSQFTLWEAGVQDWARRNNINPGVAPAENNSSDPTSPSDIPSLSIDSPTDGETITGSVLNAQITTTSASGISRVEYYLDDQLIDTVDTPPYNLSYLMSGNENGYRTLRVRSYANNGSSQSGSISLNIVLNKKLPTLQWKSPVNGQVISPSNPPRMTLDLSLPADYTLRDIKKVSVFYSKMGQGELKVLYTVIGPDSTSFSFAWPDSLTSGTYTLHAEAIDKDGYLVSQKKVRVSVQ